MKNKHNVQPIWSARAKTEQYYIEQGKMPPKEERTERWVLHHKDENLRHTDPVRYRQYLIEDVVPEKNSEHVRHHQTGKKHSEQTIERMSKAHQGKKHSEQTIERMSHSQKERRKREKEAKLLKTELELVKTEKMRKEVQTNEQ